MTTSTRHPDSGPARFIAYLGSLAARNDRAALAALRRTLGKGPAGASEAHRYVVPWLPGSAGWRTEDAYYFVAALFASHPEGWEDDGDDGPTNLGASLARLAAATRHEAVERRVIALLNAHADDLGDHLRHIVSLLRSKDVPVDWLQLLQDFQRWDVPDGPVQRAWARAFWGDTVAAIERDETPTSPE